LDRRFIVLKNDGAPVFKFIQLLFQFKQVYSIIISKALN
jgi:hypothetical protein